ncbi:MAG TPA: Dyp-type peroxidase [Dehalococcoidia bacterium]|nr:Dyp-type peroxidase [Dehalococcoidia bacterium]
MAEMRLDNVQGNILGGFNKDHQAFLFFQIPDAASGCAWLATVVRDVATCEQVVPHNRAFKAARQRLGGREPVSTGSFKAATWLNLAFTHSGLARLGVSQADLDAFPHEFREGMRRRGGLLGDVDESAPEKWIPPLRDHEIHGILLVAADHAADCDAEVRRQRKRLKSYGLKPHYTQQGKVREGDQKGHEHFGFKDGISQPGIRGVTAPNNPQDPNQGDPGQDLIQPGEFVVGYPTQHTPAAVPSPAWAADGSYLVFRRLRQDVQAFRSFVEKQAETEKFTQDLMGAKVVGRYQSGAPLERTRDQPPGFDPTRRDPSKAHPRILDDARSNNFEFGGDPDGQLVPRSAHIRKVYPRDQSPPGEDEANNHRLLRRGIAFGDSFQETAPAGSPRAGDAGFPNDRGLLFLCYQSSIARQFEYVQQQMVNNPDFPRPCDGKDPLISQDAATRTFVLPGGVRDHVTLMQRWVTTTGGDYFFSPSISALRGLSAEHKGERRASMEYSSGYMKAYAKFVATVWAHDQNVGRPQPTITTADQAANNAAKSPSWVALLKECGVDVPLNRTIIVHRNTTDEFHFVVPEPPDTNPVFKTGDAIRAIENLNCGDC